MAQFASFQELSIAKSNHRQEETFAGQELDIHLVITAGKLLRGSSEQRTTRNEPEDWGNNGKRERSLKEAAASI